MFSYRFFVFVSALCCSIQITTCSTIHDDIHVIIITNRSAELGGTEIHNFVLYKLLLAHHYSADILITPASKIETLLKSSNLSYKLFSASPSLSTACLAAEVFPLCHHNCKNILLCTSQMQLPIKELLTEYFRVKAILTLHMPMHKKKINAGHLHYANAIISANLDTLNLVKMALNPKIPMPKIEHIFPFFDEEKFLHFLPKETDRKVYFKNIGIKIGDRPVISVIANMYEHVGDYKNFPLLFTAIKKLSTPVEVMLAGDGPQRTDLEKMVKKMGLRHCIHFLGFVSNTPELLYHSDMHVLPSTKESFGLVHVEAALLKKPSIGAYGTGADMIIKEGLTGLLFQNDNATDDLAKKIKFFVNNSAFRINCGINAYHHVVATFLNATKFNKYEAIIESIAADKTA